MTAEFKTEPIIIRTRHGLSIRNPMFLPEKPIFGTWQKIDVTPKVFRYLNTLVTPQKTYHPWTIQVAWECRHNKPLLSYTDPIFLWMYCAHVQDASQEMERNSAAAKLIKVRPSRWLLLPEWHPTHKHGKDDFGAGSCTSPCKF